MYAYIFYIKKWIDIFLNDEKWLDFGKNDDSKTCSEFFSLNTKRLPCTGCYVKNSHFENMIFKHHSISKIRDLDFFHTQDLIQAKKLVYNFFTLTHHIKSIQIWWVLCNMCHTSSIFLNINLIRLYIWKRSSFTSIYRGVLRTTGQRSPFCYWVEGPLGQ